MAKRGRPRKGEAVVSINDVKKAEKKTEQKEAGGVCEFTLTADNEILLDIAKKYMLVLEDAEGEGDMTFDGLMNYLIEKALIKLIKQIADQYHMSVNQLKYTVDGCKPNGSVIRKKLETEFASIYEQHKAMFWSKTPVGTQHELFPELAAPAQSEPEAAAE